MNTKHILVVSLLLASTAAAAQSELETVVVRASNAETVDVACSNPDVSVKDTERVLGINDPSQASALRRRLIAAATEACKAGVATIEVTRGSGGRSLTWAAAE